MKSDIQIRNSADVCYIDIEGTIGVPEQWQFASPDDRVATYEKFRDAVARIAALDAPQVVVNIRSTGGDVNDALLIYDALAALDAEVTTRCYGYVASAATLIAQAASEGRREISAGALYLVHAAACAAEGNAAELEARAELLRKTDERLAALYARRSGRPQEEFAQRMAENNGNGRWLSPEETVAAGLADQRGRRTAATSSTSTTRIRPPAVRRSKPPKGSGATVRRRCLRPKTRRSAKSAARPTKRPMPPTRGSSRRGYNGGRFPKNRREISPLFCTPAPGARADAVTASAIFAVRSHRPEACHVRTQTNNHRRAQRTTVSALRKSGKKNGRRMRRRKRGRELVRVAFQAQAVGRSPTFSPCGHFWRHLLVSKGGKNCFSQETLQLSFGMSHRFCRPIPSKTSISRNPLRLPSQEDGTDFQFLIFHS